MSDLIPLSVPHICGNEWKYIKECLDSGWVSSAGKYVDIFENIVARYTGSKYAIACVNGTSALHIALMIAGVKRNDEVIVPTLTFIAPVNVIRYCGAHPVFMDSDEYCNIDVDKTISFIKKETIFRNNHTYNKTTKKIIKALIPVHVFGNAVRLDNLYNLCKERNIKLVEDATEALGTIYTKGKFAGRHPGTIGELGCLSFNGNKIITTGGGGMILTDDYEFAKKAKYLTTQAKDDEIRYIHNNIGYNYRLTNIQAALGVAQFEMLPSILKIKKSNYNFYKKYIDKIEGLSLAPVPTYAESNHWMYALRIDEKEYGLDKDETMGYLSSNNVQTRPVWQLNHIQKMYRKCQNYHIDTAVKIYNNVLNIPCGVGLLKKEIKTVIKYLNSVNRYKIN